MFIMSTTSLLVTALSLLVTLVQGRDHLRVDEPGLEVTTTRAVDVTDDGIIRDTPISVKRLPGGGSLEVAEVGVVDNSLSYLVRGAPGGGDAMPSCVQKSRCTKSGGICQEEGSCPGKLALVSGCSRRCSCCAPIPTVDQCSKEDGFCAVTGDRCNGTIKLLHNFCDDQCTCCVPDNQGDSECVSPWVSIGESAGCFLFVQSSLNWDDARAYCQNEEGDLAVLNVESKRIEMVDYLEDSGLKHTSSTEYPKFWLGATDRSGTWLWLNGSPVTDGGWKGNQEPDDDAGDDTCMYVYTKPYPPGRYDLLFDYYCTFNVGTYFICEK
ncbi:unnamed protein product [Meganyctiphanes norvegica]|uniref:C-type lectin domain-containing protein n=1 Tax=Meganyctiphanes norvegica TaxID=48144 RepID=A0AAV2SGE1_MEGNR